MTAILSPEVVRDRNQQRVRLHGAAFEECLPRGKYGAVAVLRFVGPFGPDDPKRRRIRHPDPLTST